MPPSPANDGAADALMGEFYAEARDHLTSGESALLALERVPGDHAAIEAAFRAFHSVKGSAAPLGLFAVRDLGHAVEGLLAALRDRRLAADRALIGTLLEAVDGLRALLDRAQAGTPDPADPIVHRDRLDRLDGLARQAGAPVAAAPVQAQDPVEEARALCAGEPDAAGQERLAALLARLPGRCSDPAARAIAEEVLAAWHDTVPATGLTEVVRDWLAGRLAALAALAPAPAPAREAPVSGAGDGQTMRVAAARIDDLLRFAGDLLELGDRLGRMPERVRRLAGGGPQARDLRRLCEELSRTTDHLRQAVLEIRRLPAEVLLPRLRRVLRDACAATGKEVDLAVEGTAVEVDKTLIELLEAQLPHLVRNAVDHGIEAAGVRTAAGKPAAGTLRLAVSRPGNEVRIELVDDGGGLDLERLRAKGEAMGLLVPGQTASDEELAELIFASGLTTAAQVSEISGRGVGMDAVRRAVEGAGGRIAVSSRRGEGTRLVIDLPAAVTTRILAGYLVRTGGIRAVLPLERVRETFRPGPDEVAGTGAGARGVQRHGRILPVLDLAGQLGRDGGGRVMVAVSCRRRTVALAVDEVLGVQQVVVRPLDGLPDHGGLYLGAALLGDGAVALVLDPDSLISPTSTSDPRSPSHA